MAIVQTLQRTNWNKQEAAQVLGLYRPTLYSKMKKHDIKDQRAAQRAAAASSTNSSTPAANWGSGDSGFGIRDLGSGIRD